MLTPKIFLCVPSFLPLLTLLSAQLDMVKPFTHSCSRVGASTTRLLAISALLVSSAVSRDCKQITRSAALKDPCSLLESSAPPSFLLSFQTNYGELLALCDRSLAPAWVDRVFNLAVGGYYSSNYFIRVVDSPTLHVAQFGTNGDPSISNVYNIESPQLGDCAVVRPQPPFMDIGSPSLSNTLGTLSMSTSFNPLFNTTWNATAELFLNLGNNSRLDALLFVPICTLTSSSIDVALSFPSYGELEDLGGPGPSLARLYAEGNEYISSDPAYDLMASTTSVSVSCEPLDIDGGGGDFCGPCEAPNNGLGGGGGRRAVLDFGGGGVAMSKGDARRVQQAWRTRK